MHQFLVVILLINGEREQQSLRMQVHHHEQAGRLQQQLRDDCNVEHQSSNVQQHLQVQI
jgi:hypothetical protein